MTTNPIPAPSIILAFLAISDDLTDAACDALSDLIIAHPDDFTLDLFRSIMTAAERFEFHYPHLLDTFRDNTDFDANSL